MACKECESWIKRLEKEQDRSAHKAHLLSLWRKLYKATVANDHEGIIRAKMELTELE